MSYFSNRYNKIKLPIKEASNTGLRNSQLGAIHSIPTHFTLREEPAIIVMPTGSGKTAVLTLSPFFTRAKRVLVVTPSVLVRDQIFEEFKTLKTLKSCGCIAKNFKPPKVKRIKKRVNSKEEWLKYEKYDVCVSMPNVSSPGMKNVVKPPSGLFDLILVDEAHHSPAKTWAKLLDSIPNAKKILFTATPYRKDKKEINGKFIYEYPLRKAHEDGIFGDIDYLPVKWDGRQNPDVEIAKYAELIYKKDKELGYDHRLMVRTDRQKRADELKDVYSNNTNLNLQVIHSRYSYKYIKKTIKLLEENKLDGIICVSMLGEGFDFPQLKIAAIHIPHKSIEITLQFIGRFARTSSQRIGKAKFLAIPNQIEFETKRLYEEGSTWQEIIANLSATKIGNEAKVREKIDSFNQARVADFELKNLSLYAIRPYSHVKIYEVDGEVDLESDIELPKEFEIVYNQYSSELSTTILITRETLQPKWSSLDILQKIEYDLFVIYFHEDANLLFINSSRRKSISMYEKLVENFCIGQHKILESFKINRILKDIDQIDCFNIGMRNRVKSPNTESYRIIAGPHAQEAIRKSDGRLFHRGHIFAKVDSKGLSSTIGYSSSSKVWKNQNSQIPTLIEWCKELGNKINSEGIIHTGSNLDILKNSTPISKIPKGIIAADWHENAYKHPWKIQYKDKKGIFCDLIDCEIKICDFVGDDRINLLFIGPSFEWPLTFSLNSMVYFSKNKNSVGSITISNQDESIDIIDYFNNYPLQFYTWNFERFSGNELFYAPKEFDTYNREKINIIDWKANNVDITNEFNNDTEDGISIHEYLKTYLLKSNFDAIFYDHGTGEIADLIAIKLCSHYTEVTLYHCKSSHEKFAGDRVSDIYEVTGQVIKSSNLNNYPQLHQHFIKRLRRNSFFIKGNTKTVEACFKRKPQMKTIIALVQPGISSSKISQKNLNIIAAADDFVRGTGLTEMIIIASE